MSNNKPLRRGVSGVRPRSTCECERDGPGAQCVWLTPAEAEFECLGEPSLCQNPRGCACSEDHIEEELEALAAAPTLPQAAAQEAPGERA